MKYVDNKINTVIRHLQNIITVAATNSLNVTEIDCTNSFDDLLYLYIHFKHKNVDLIKNHIKKFCEDNNIRILSYNIRESKVSNDLCHTSLIISLYDIDFKLVNKLLKRLKIQASEVSPKVFYDIINYMSHYKVEENKFNVEEVIEDLKKFNALSEDYTYEIE